MTERIFIGIPAYGETLHSSFLAARENASAKNRVAHISVMNLSSLTMCYNALLTGALNLRKKGVTHFLLWHSDIIPLEDCWLDTLLDEMNRFDADVISAFSPLKDHTGLTSTGLLVESSEEEKKDAPWRDVKVERFSLKDLYANHPVTFTHEKMMLNTGLMLIDLRKPWLYQGKMPCFQFQDSIELHEDGDYRVAGYPECVLLAKVAHERKAKFYATRKVLLSHYGQMGFTNSAPWGSVDRPVSFGSIMSYSKAT